MDLKENWIVKIHNNLRIGKEQINPKDYTFFNVEHIQSAASHTVNYLQNCTQCKKNKEELLKLSEEFPELLQTIQGRKQFNNRLDQVLKHLRKEHKIYPKDYITSIYTLTGVLIGALLAWLISRFNILTLYASMPVFLGMGLIIGWFSGKKRESKLRKENKFL